MLRPIRSADLNSSKRRVPVQAWRRIRRFQLSPRTSALRAMVHGHFEVSVRLIVTNATWFRYATLWYVQLRDATNNTRS